MPLIVPGLTGSSSSSGSKEEWMGKLAGKKIGDQHDEINFAKQDLPKEHRVLGPDSFSTADHKPDRLNIHTDKDGTVRDVKFG